MQAIFISYRREDTEGQAGRLFDDLVKYFGENGVFMDVVGIGAGKDFRHVIDGQVASCGVLLALIGRNWLTAADENGKRRLDDEKDFVRLETASALKRDIPVIPVLVRGAQMPRAEELPADLAELAYRNGVELNHARWESDVQLLVKALQPYIEVAKQQSPEETSHSLNKKSGLLRRISFVAIAVFILIAIYTGYKKITGSKINHAAILKDSAADTNKTVVIKPGPDSNAGVGKEDTSLSVIPTSYTLEGIWEDDEGKEFVAVADKSEKNTFELEQIKPVKTTDELWKATLSNRDVEIDIFTMPSGSHQGRMNLSLSIDGKRMVGLLGPGGASPDFTPVPVHFRRTK